MRKTKTDPGAASLRELPEIDFSRYRVRRNPFATRIAREGIVIAHDEPSAVSLEEMPEADFARSRVRRNPYASRAAEPVDFQYGRGRPARDREVGATHVRSLRLPERTWTALEEEARDKHTTVHALLRELVATHLARRSRR